MDYLQVPIKVIKDATLEYRFVGPSDTQPTPATGYTIDPQPIDLSSLGIPGKLWIEYKVIEAP